MTRASTPPLEVTTVMQRFGENVRLARVRRRMGQEELAQACGVTRKTLATIERGAAGASLATALTLLWKLGLLGTTAALADPEADEHGKILEAAQRPQRVRRPIDNGNDF